jgi:hypothetical protein
MMVVARKILNLRYSLVVAISELMGGIEFG